MENSIASNCMQAASKLAIQNSRSLNDDEWRAVMAQATQEAFDLGVIKFAGEMLRIVKETSPQGAVSVKFLENEVKRVFAEISMTSEPIPEINIVDHLVDVSRHLKETSTMIEDLKRAFLRGVN